MRSKSSTGNDSKLEDGILVIWLLISQGLQEELDSAPVKEHALSRVV
jgi:hypothetical protein